MILKRNDALFLNAPYCYDVKCRKCLYFLTFDLCHFIFWILQQMKMQFMMKHRCPKDVDKFHKIWARCIVLSILEVLGVWYEQQQFIHQELFARLKMNVRQK